MDGGENDNKLRGIDLSHIESLARLQETVDGIARAARPISDAHQTLRAALPNDSLRSAIEAAQQWEKAMGPIRDVQERMKSLAGGAAVGSRMYELADEIARQSRTLDEMRPYAFDMAGPPHLPPLPPNPAHETNERLAQIEGQFGEMHGLAVGYATVANRLQAAVAELVAKFDVAAADTTRSARLALTISVIATILTLLGVIVPIAYTEFWQAPVDAAETEAFRQQVAGEIAGMREAQEAETNRLIEAIRELDRERLGQLLDAIRAERQVAPAGQE
jgi:hypothetical protein